MNEALEIYAIKLIFTCDCCPEQYEALRDGMTVGYLRLRHGHYPVQCPDAGGELVYEASPLGDGMFEPEERAKFVQEGAKAVKLWVAKHLECN